MNAQDRLDGNVLGGPLADFFQPDVTAATIDCAHCGSAAILAEYDVYPDAPALVVRCPTCARVVLRVASDQFGLRLEMSGVRLMSLPAPDRDGLA
ncbi:DUF6510 family protein [Actinocatenispora sera]|jgi:hypothetical protein|uniref:Uncharacterized protein n=1 Tax=Actinocatenispora sera TaxID=390989 RepID=A0A810L2J8_9ACTN|nr:DUF6510 family protein [Actinocatenispora sera]BCJ28631.1 hypothetical protein Asera_27390 [Actinocatenispora sera]